MRFSALFGVTLRQAPAEAETRGYQFLLRAGYIRQVSQGIFAYLPLAQRALSKIETILREEMDAIGGQEITMPVTHPADLWKETQRWYAIGPELLRFRDRADRDMVLGMTHEEIVADLVRKDIRSYRQLPRLVYQIQTKFRDEPRARAGLIRVREFTMKDAYSLDADWEGLDEQYRNNYQAYFNIFRRAGLPVIAVRSDVGMMGGTMAHEFMYLSAIGEDTLLICDESGYAANREVARFTKPPAASEDPAPLQKVATPGTTTIAALAEFLNIPAAKTAKAVFMMATVKDSDGYVDKFVLATIRGDMDVNETKLTNALGAKAMRPATEDEIRAVGAVPGYGSAIGVKGALLVIDEAVASSPNLVAGANEAGSHYLNTNYGRDYAADIVTDIAAARAGDLSPDGAGTLREVRGVEVGNIFKLGTRYTAALGATFLDASGETKPVIMGSYGIGVGRLLGCLAEHYNDDKGLCWPITVAPYQVQLLSLNIGEASHRMAEQLYSDLRRAGVEVLFDDRDERPGIKFNDADLLGMPLRVTVGAKSLEQGGVEVRRRTEQQNRIVPVDQLVSVIQAEIAEMQRAIQKTVREVPFRE